MYPNQPQDSSNPNDPIVQPTNPYRQPESPIVQPPQIPTPGVQAEMQQPAAPAVDAYNTGQQPLVESHENPGQTLGIVSIILSFLGLSLVGIILGVISRKKSKAANSSTALGTIGLVIGIVSTIGTIILLGFFLTIALTAATGIQARAIDSQTQSDANRIVKQAEIYNIENRKYPSTASELDTSSISTETKIVEATPSSAGQVQYRQCEGGQSAQVLYFTDTKSGAVILPIGTASSTIPC